MSARHVRTREVSTPEGQARVLVHRPAPTAQRDRGSLVLGHGAGGGTDAADLQVASTLLDDGWTVAYVEQPWRVAGRRVATPPPSLDRAFLPVLAALTSGRWALPRPLVTGGRSAGARVACRTCTDAPPADAVVALAFPLHPPGRPERSRALELLAPLQAGLPTLVAQGNADPFGGPDEIRSAMGTAAGRLDLVALPGNHGPTRDLAGLRSHLRRFLDALP